MATAKAEEGVAAQSKSGLSGGFQRSSGSGGAGGGDSLAVVQRAAAAAAEAAVVVAVVAVAGEVAGGAAAAEAVMAASAKHRDRNNRPGAVQGCPDVATTRAMVARHWSCEGLMVLAAGVVGVGGDGNSTRPRDRDWVDDDCVDACNDGGESENQHQHQHQCQCQQYGSGSGAHPPPPPSPPNIKLIPRQGKKELWLPWPLGAVHGE
jgi:hypothetical protein